MFYSVHIAAAGEDVEVAPEQLEDLAEHIAEHQGVAAGSTGRYEATFSVVDQVGTVIDAVQDAVHIFVAAAKEARLPEWPLVRLEVLTDDERDRELAESPVPPLVGVNEIAEMLEVTRQRVHALAQTARFPAPVASLAASPVWNRHAIERFAERWDRTPGRRPSRTTRDS